MHLGSWTVSWRCTDSVCGIWQNFPDQGMKENQGFWQVIWKLALKQLIWRKKRYFCSLRDLSMQSFKVNLSPVDLSLKSCHFNLLWHLVGHQRPSYSPGVLFHLVLSLQEQTLALKLAEDHLQEQMEVMYSWNNGFCVTYTITFGSDIYLAGKRICLSRAIKYLVFCHKLKVVNRE